MHLVLIETSGNQHFIFATNRLRENIGASELTHRAGTQYIWKALSQIFDAPGAKWDKDQDRRPTTLKGRDPKIEDGAQYEVIVATSGKALVLVRERAKAEKLIEAVTLRALQEAPGLAIGGVISDDFDFSSGSLHHFNDQVHRRYEMARSAWGTPRFLRLPVVRDCATTSFPAEGWGVVGKGYEVQSRVARAKQEAAEAQIERMRLQFPEDRLLSSLAQLEEYLAQEDEANWVAVVHADGNGFGKIFLEFGALAMDCGFHGNRAYIDAYRNFSLALDQCTKSAFSAALAQMPMPSRKREHPVVPLVLGGDDLTALCPGTYALDFAHNYLQAFEAASMVKGGKLFDDILPTIAGAAGKAARLASCAGVAVVKSHYPFHAAYDLAEALVRSAKVVKDTIPLPCSAFDFHVLYDSSVADLDLIRQRLRRDDCRTHLYARPVIATKGRDLEGCEPEAASWLEARAWERLRKGITAIQKRRTPAPGESVGAAYLPNAQLHDLRAGLFLGRAEADARLGLMYSRYRGDELEVLLGSVRSDGRPSLFWDENGTAVARLLDAMDAAAVTS